MTVICSPSRAIHTGALCGAPVFINVLRCAKFGRSISALAPEDRLMPITIPFHCALLAEHSNGIVPPKGALTNLRRLCLWVLLLALLSAPLAHADSQGSLAVDGRTRTYQLHVPASYTASEPMPLLVL